MTENEFFLELFPQEYELLDIKNFKDFEGEPFHFVKHIDELDVLRSPEEGGVCECVNGNTNKALVLYFQSILHQDIELPIFINSRNQIPVYRNKSYRIHGFCWKKGIEGRRRLRHKTW